MLSQFSPKLLLLPVCQEITGRQGYWSVAVTLECVSGCITISNLFWVDSMICVISSLLLGMTLHIA